MFEKAYVSNKIINCVKDELLAGNCSICRESLENEELKIGLTTCGHLFHKYCLNNSLQYNDSCPNCREKLKGGIKRPASEAFSDDTMSVSS